MKWGRPSGAWLIVASIGLAMFLTVLPVPGWAAAWRPEWVALVLVYWCMALPERVGIGTAAAVGLLVDALEGNLLGQHAAGFALVAYCTLCHYRRLNLFPLLQQMACVGGLLSINALVMSWVHGITGSSLLYAVHWLPVLTSMAVWPWLVLMLRELNRKWGGVPA